MYWKKGDGGYEHDGARNVHEVGGEQPASLTGTVEENAGSLRYGKIQTADKGLIYILFRLI